MNKNQYFKEARNIKAESGIEAKMMFIKARHNNVDIKVNNMTMIMFPEVARKICETEHFQYVKGFEDLDHIDINWYTLFKEYDLLVTVKSQDVGIWEEKLERIIHANA